MGGVSANPPAGAQPVDKMKARVEAERAGRPFLLYRDGDDRQQLFPLDPGAPELSVGRKPSSDLALAWDGQVSRLHARLELVEGAWTVADDGLSRNGTFVNGERLRGRRRLNDGDSLRFGTTTVTFRSPKAEEQAATPAADEAPAPVDLSTTQRRVLTALCRPYQDGSALATPATDEQIAEELFVSPGAVRTHLAVLFAKFGIVGRHRDQKRVRLVELAFSAGLISGRDGT
jgi:hypothetical protein